MERYTRVGSSEKPQITELNKSGTLNKRQDVAGNSLSVNPPSAAAAFDNQGDANTCTRHAIGKAVCDGFHKDLYGVGQSVDLIQGEVISALMQEHKNVNGKWPDSFDNTQHTLQDKNDFAWSNVHLEVKKAYNPLQFKSDIRRNKPTYQWVLVYDVGNNETHCVYVRSLENNVLKCIDSHGNKDPEPEISLQQLQSKIHWFYSVRCAAMPMSVTPSNGTNQLRGPLSGNKTSSGSQTKSAKTKGKQTSNGGSFRRTSTARSSINKKRNKNNRTQSNITMNLEEYVGYHTEDKKKSSLKNKIVRVLKGKSGHDPKKGYETCC